MATRLVVLNGGTQLAASATLLVTGGTNVFTKVITADFTNTSGGAETLTVYRIPNGGSPSDAVVVINERSIASNETYVSPELAGLVLAPGDTIQALASTLNTISAQISGFTTTN